MQHKVLGRLSIFEGKWMVFHLKNQGAIVTGAARGIGLAISRRFAELGANVSGWDLNM